MALTLFLSGWVALEMCSSLSLPTRKWVPVACGCFEYSSSTLLLRAEKRGPWEH